MTDLYAIAARSPALWNGDLKTLDQIVAETIVTHAVLLGQSKEEPMIGRDALGGWLG